MSAEPRLVEPEWTDDPTRTADVDAYFAALAEASRNGTGATIDDDPEPGSDARPGSFQQRVAATRVDLLARIRDGVPDLEYVPGCAGRYVRGRRHYLPGPKKTGKSFTTALDAVDIPLAGGRIVIFDRENGADLYAARVEAIITARGLDADQRDRVAAGLAYFEFPRLGKTDEADLVSLCAGADLVVFDSQRMFLSDLGLDENDSDDYAEFMAALVDPLFRAGIATLILDNAGHADPKRGRGSSSKADLNEILFTIETVEEWNTDTTGRLRLDIAHSRLGTSGRWELEIGGGIFGNWKRADQNEATSPTGTFRPTGKMERVSIFVESCSEPVSRNTVTDAIGGNARYARVAIDCLVREQYLRSIHGPNRAKLVETIQPYREATDPLLTEAENDAGASPSASHNGHPERVPSTSGQLPLNHAETAGASECVPSASPSATHRYVPPAGSPYGEPPGASPHDEDPEP